MDRLSPRNQMIIAAAVVAVLAVAVVMLVIVPTFDKAAELDAQIQTENQNLMAAQALLARRQSAKAQSAANEVELMRIANQVPDTPQLPSVIIELQEIANLSDVALAQVSAGDIEVPETEEGSEPAQYSIVPINVVVEGGWVDITDFFHRLDRMHRGHRIASVTVNYVPETEEEPAHIEADLALEVYVMAAMESGPKPPELPSEEATESTGATSAP